MTDLAEADRRAVSDAPRSYASRFLQPRANARLRQFGIKVLPALAFCLIAPLAWEWMSRVMASPLVPGIGEVGGEIIRIIAAGAAAEQIGLTLYRILLGFTAAFITALVIGIVAARSAIVRSFFDPVIVLGLTVPGLVWALLCVIWFGVGWLTPTVSIALGVAPALILQVVQGMRAVDAEIMEMAHVFKLSRRAKLRYVWFPLLVPYLFGGARIGLSLAWKVIVLVELFGMSNGVGYQLNAEFSSQNVAGVLAWTIVFWVVMAGIEYGLLQTLERYSSRWRKMERI